MGYRWLRRKGVILFQYRLCVRKMTVMYGIQRTARVSKFEVITNNRLGWARWGSVFGCCLHWAPPVCNASPYFVTVILYNCFNWGPPSLNTAFCFRRSAIRVYELSLSIIIRKGLCLSPKIGNSSSQFGTAVSFTWFIEMYSTNKHIQPHFSLQKTS
jgi:hypothetical protein